MNQPPNHTVSNTASNSASNTVSNTVSNSASNTVHNPPEMPYPPPPDIVGHREEMRFLDGLAERLSRGEGAVVAFDGVAGIGKTALASALAARLHSNNHRVVWGRAHENGDLHPFAPLVHALDCRLDHPDRRRAAVATALVDDGQRSVDPFRFQPDPGWRYPAQEALLDLLLDLAEEQPIAVIVDDLHWADEGTVEVLGALARRTDRRPILVGWTARSSPRNPAVERLIARAADRLRVVHVGPLDPASAHELATRVAGGAFTEATSTGVARAHGNPYLVTAAAKAESDGTVLAPIAAFRALPPEAAAAVSVAAVLGRVFDLNVAAAVLGTTLPSLRSCLAPLHATGLLGGPVESLHCEFAHDLVRDAVIGELPQARLAALHRDAARVLERLGASDERIAVHLSRGAVFGDVDAAERIRMSAATVVRHDAMAAAELLAGARTLCEPGSVLWLSISAERIAALQWAGRAAEAMHLADEAVHEAGQLQSNGTALDPQALAQLQIVHAWGRGMVGDLPGCIAEIRMIASDTAVAPAGRACLLAELATLEVWGNDRAAGRARAVEAIALAREYDVLQAELQGMCAVSATDSFEGDVVAAVHLAREAQQLGRTFPGMSPARELYLALALANSDEFDEALLWVQAGLDRAMKVSDLWLVARNQTARTAIALLSGDWEVAVADAEAVVALRADTGILNGLPQVAAIAAIISLARGDQASVLRWVAISRELATPTAEMSGMLYHAWMEALVAEHAGRSADAATVLRHVFDVAGRAAPLVQLWLAPDLVRIQLAARDVDRVPATVASVVAFATRVGTRSAHATAQFCAGLAVPPDRPGAAVDFFADAFAATAAIRRLPLRRSIGEALAAALVSEGRSVEAEPVVREVAVLGAEFGIAVPAVQAVRSRSEHAAASEHDRHLAGLTPTEKRVADQVSEGLTNPQIALALGLSKRTVEFYLSSLYLKLELNSRVELATLIGSATERRRN